MHRFNHYTGPDSPPENVTTVVTSSTSIMVTWNAVSLIDQNGIITEYEVQYVPLETFGNTIGIEMVNTSAMSYLLSNLEEFVNYNISVRAYTVEGRGPYSDPIMTQTFEDGKIKPLMSYYVIVMNHICSSC